MKILVLLLSIALCPLSVLCEDAVNVGIIAAFSGDGAGYGESFKNGVTMGVADLPQEFKDKIKFHYEDDGMVSRNTISAFQKLTSTIKLDGVVTFSSGTSNALVSLTERAEVPLLGLASDAKVSKGKKYAFNFWVTPDVEGQLAFEEAKKEAIERSHELVLLMMEPLRSDMHLIRPTKARSKSF